jgi:hypothetical protein
VKDVFANLLAWSLLRDTPCMEHETDCIVQSNSCWMLSTTTRTVAASIVLLVSCSGLQAGVLVVPIGSLRYITYGAKYPGLEEHQRPLRLKRGKRYEVFAYTRAKGFDLFAFRVG